MQRPDTEDGLFAGGNALTGQKGTGIPVAWLNALLQVSVLLSGLTEPPAAELGGENDLYLCLVTRNLYGPKVAGEWGDPWQQGLPGVRGHRWYYSVGEPAEQLGQLAGDGYLDVQNGDIWVLAAVWELQGNIGAFTVLSGARDPLVTDGRDGDWWINKLTLTIFGPRTDGAWGDGTALRGQQGIQGPPGAALAAVWADIQTIDSSMALAGYDVIYLGDTTAGALIWTAPTAIGKKGRQLYVENIGAAGNDLTLNGFDAETIEGQAGVLLEDGIGLKFYSDGAVWRRLKG